MCLDMTPLITGSDHFFCLPHRPVLGPVWPLAHSNSFNKYPLNEHKINHKDKSQPQQKRRTATLAWRGFSHLGLQLSPSKGGSPTERDSRLAMQPRAGTAGLFSK